MRKFYCLSAGLAACGIAGLAAADDFNTVSATPEYNAPVKVAKINSNYELTTPWYYIDNAVDQYPCGSTALYDSYEPNSTGFPANNPTCNLGSGVRYLLTNFCTAGNYDDMNMATGVALGAYTEHLDLLWQNTITDVDLLIGVFPSETDFAGCQALTSTYSGVIIGFVSPAAGFYYSNVDLCTAGIALTMPTDGAGGFVEQYFGRFESGTNFDFHSCAQPGLWAATDVASQGGPDDPITVYDLSAEGSFDTTECVDLGFNTCPDPLQSAIGFWGFAGPSDCLVLSNTGYVAGASTTWAISGGTPGQKGVVVYGFNAGSLNLNGFDIAGRTWCAEIGIAGVNPSKIVGNPKILDANGEATWSKTIPLNQQGNTILTQAVGSDTCPDPCQSAVDSTTVI